MHACPVLSACDQGNQYLYSPVHHIDNMKHLSHHPSETNLPRSLKVNVLTSTFPVPSKLISTEMEVSLVTRLMVATRVPTAEEEGPATYFHTNRCLQPQHVTTTTEGPYLPLTRCLFSAITLVGGIRSSSSARPGRSTIVAPELRREAPRLGAPWPLLVTVPPDNIQSLVSDTALDDYTNSTDLTIESSFGLLLRC